MTQRRPDQLSLTPLERRLGHFFARPGLLLEALNHRSYVYEHPQAGLRENERLEFLGDAVLELAVTALVSQRHPQADEGRLTRLRAAVVNEASLAELARRLELGPWLCLGRGETINGGADKPSILADAVEAVLGAVFLDAGFEAAREVINRLWGPLLDGAEEEPVLRDGKSRLQEMIQERRGLTPVYRLVASQGPDHRRTFFVEVRAGDQVMGSGQGGSKKEAEQAAAAAALAALEEAEADA